MCHFDIFKRFPITVSDGILYRLCITIFSSVINNCSYPQTSHTGADVSRWIRGCIITVEFCLNGRAWSRCGKELFFFCFVLFFVFILQMLCFSATTWLNLSVKTQIWVDYIELILQSAWGAAGAERWAAGLHCSRWDNLPAWQHVAHIPRIPQASTSCTALWGLPFYSSVTFSLVCDYDIIHKDRFNPSGPLMLSFECVLLCPFFPAVYF